MQQLARLDISRPFVRPQSRIAAQCLFGAACAGVMIAMRSVIDVVAPHAGPFAMVYPAVVLATLYGHLFGGLVAYTVGFGWAWYVVLPPVHTFGFNTTEDATIALINAITLLVVLVLAESFRRAGTIAMAERDAEIVRRTMLLEELEHRTKNNFALVVSLLELQKRREADPRVADALDMATARIHSFARAYANLAETQGEGGTVQMGPYLREVVTHFADGAFHDGIKVSCKASECQLDREVAVAIGLFTNEALTNSAKHAFPDGADGMVEVRFICEGTGWELLVRDNGVGAANAEHNQSGSGLRTTLMRAFAQQARARYEDETSESGRSLRLISN